MGKLKYMSKVFLGQTVDFMAGVNVSVKDLMGKTIVGEQRQNLKHGLQTDEEISKYFESLPVLKPCENFKTLVNNFYSNYKIEGRKEEFFGTAELEEFSEGFKDRAKALADYLGIPCKYIEEEEGSKYSFVLVYIPRIISTQKLSKEGMLELAKQYNTRACKYDNNYEKSDDGEYLKTYKNIKNALNFVSEGMGTHYVKSITTGDRAFQVFVYEKSKYDLLCKSMDKSGWTGINSLGFRYFTSKIYCSCVGKLKLLSEDESFNNIRNLLEDKVYNVKESIFSIVTNDKVQNEMAKMEKVVLIGAEFDSITNLENLKVNSLLQGATVQGCIARFGAEGAGPAYYKVGSVEDYASIYEDFNFQNTISALWTPFQSISQMYVNLNLLINSHAINIKDTKNIIITADVIEINEDLDLSNIDNLIIGCRLFIAGKDGNVPSITLSKSAMEGKRFYCETMKGNCTFREKENLSNSQLIFDNIASSFVPSGNAVSYEEFFSGKFPTNIFYLKEEDTYTKWAKASLKTGIQTLLMSASVPVMPRTIKGEKVKKTACEAYRCISWISQYTKRAVEEGINRGEAIPDEINWLYTHAVMTLKDAINPFQMPETIMPQVPTLRYTAYKESINRLLEVSEEYSNVIQNVRSQFNHINEEIEKEYVQEKRDENIKRMAQFMIDQNKALAEKEEDITKCHNEIITKKHDMISQLNSREQQLRADYATYSAKLTAARDNINKAIEKKKKEERAKASMEFIFGITECILGIVTASYNFATLGDATGAARTVKKWDAFTRYTLYINKIITNSEKLASYIGEINTFDKLTEKEGFKNIEPPTDSDWEIFMNDCIAMVKPIENLVKGATAEFIAQVKNVTAVAKLLNHVLEQKAQYEYDIFVENVNSNISKKQRERLNNLELNLKDVKWSPDTDYLADLGQFDAIMQQKENEVLLKLVELVRLQNDAMTFFYLSEPSVVTKFDIISIKNMLAEQEISAVRALETYPYPPTDIVDPIEIKVDNVFIEELLGERGIEVQVDMNENLFETLARVRINYLDVRVDGVSTDTGKCHIKLESLGTPMVDRGLKREVLSYKTISREWHVVYDIESNKTIIGTKPAEEWGTYFTKPTPFQKFRIFIPKTSENRGIQFKNKITSLTLSFNVEAVYSESYRKRLKASSSPENFLYDLKGTSITDGWDVVSFISVDKINALWKDRWQKEIDKAYEGERKFIQSINVTYTQKIMESEVRYDFNMDMGAPWLEFLADSDSNVLVNIPIIKGNLKTTFNGKSEDAPIVQTPDNPAIIKTKCEMSKLQGRVNESTVCINLGDHPFALEDIKIDPVLQANLCEIISTYVKNENLPPWYLGTLKHNTTVDFLKPKSFSFKTYKSNDDNKPDVLALYILTTKEKAPAHGMRRVWPDDSWIVSKEMDAAVYFSADLLWNKEIIPAVQSKLGNVNLSIDKNKLNFVGTKEIFRKEVPIKHGWERSGLSVVNEKATVNMPLSNIELSLAMTEMKLTCDDSWKDKFPYQDRTPFPDPDYPDVQYDTAWDDVSFTCSFNASSSATIDKEDFSVTFDKLNISPNINATYPSHKVWFIPLPELNKQLVDNAKTSITNTIKAISISFDSMSMFAVTNVLFPESKVMEPKGVYFPHDLVILGNGAVPEKVDK